MAQGKISDWCKYFFFHEEFILFDYENMLKTRLREYGKSFLFDMKKIEKDKELTKGRENEILCSLCNGKDSGLSFESKAGFSAALYRHGIAHFGSKTISAGL